MQQQQQQQLVKGFIPFEDYSAEIRTYTDPASKAATARREEFQAMADLLIQHVAHRLPAVDRGVNDPPLGEATRKSAAPGGKSDRRPEVGS